MPRRIAAIVLTSLHGVRFLHAHRHAAQRTLVALALGALAASAVVEPAGAQALEKVSLRLDYLLNGYHAPFYLARERGYYKDAGLDVAIAEGKGSTGTIQAVAAGADMFGLANLATAAVAITKGVPLIGVGGLIQKLPDAVIALADSNIRSPKDVEGKRGAFVPTGAGDRLFPAFARVNNIDTSTIKRVSISSEARFSVLLQGNADFIVAWSLGDAYRINKQKPIAPPLVFSDFGVTMLGTGVIVTKEMAANRPALVRSFLAASAKGLQDMIDDPSAGVAAITKIRPEIDPELLLVGISGLARFVRTANSANMPLLAMAKADWEETTKNLVTYLGMAGQAPPEAFYTNDFLTK